LTRPRRLRPPSAARWSHAGRAHSGSPARLVRQRAHRIAGSSSGRAARGRGFMDQLVEINIYYYIILDRVARDRAGGPGRPLPGVRGGAGRADPRRPGPEGRPAPAPQVGGPAVPRLSRPDHGRDFLSRLAADPAFRRGTAAALGPTSQPFTL